MKTTRTTWTLTENKNYIVTVHHGWNVGIGIDDHGPHVIAIKAATFLTQGDEG